MRKKRLILQPHLTVDEEEEKISITVDFFDSLNGLDESILNLVNDKIAQIKTIYQERSRMNLRYQESLIRKINYFNKLSPNAYGIVNLSLQEICESLAVIETDCHRLWKYMNNAYGSDFFLAPVERQYGRRFARDYDALHSEVDKVKDEAKYHIDTIINQSENELTTLRKIIDDRQQEITQLHEKFYHDIEKSKVELMFTMETDF